MFTKKGLEITLIIFMLLILSPMISKADKSSDDAGLDVLILLDNGYSLTYKDDPTDSKGYRFDAVGSFISLMNAENVRANYFLFNNSILQYDGHSFAQIKNDGEIAMKDISLSLGRSRRNLMLNELMLPQKARSRNANGGTNIALALETAIDVLSREDIGHKKVIIVFSDGKNRLTYGNDVTARKREQDLLDLNERTVAARKRAEELNISIHTVLLKDSSALEFMQNDVKTSDGLFYMASNASDLPEKFIRIFAFENGNVIHAASGVAKKESSIKMQVPNNSVNDLNVIVPLAHIDPKSLSLVSPSGEVITDLEEHNYQFVSNNYAIYKILSPEKGEWKLLYHGDDSEYEITALYLLNYDLTLAVETSNHELQKNDPLFITASFQKDGSLVHDASLYSKTAEVTISKDGKTIIADNMSFSEGKYIYSIESLKSFAAGTYSVSVSYKGEDFSKENSNVAFTVLNKEPVVNEENGNEIDYSFKINIPGDEASFEIQKQVWDLSTIVSDPDGSPVTYTIEESPSFIDSVIENSKLTVTTKGNSTGSGDIRISTKDSDQKQGPVITIHIQVASAIEALNSIVYADTQNITKNSDSVSIRVQFTENGTTLTTGKYYDMKATATLKKDDKILRSGIDLTYDGKGYVYTFENLKQYGAGNFIIEVRIQSGTYIMDCEPVTVTLTNSDPQLVSSSSIESSFEINNPVIEGSYELQTKEYDLSQYIKDADGDALTWSIASKEPAVDAKIVGSKFSITTKKDTATDGNIVVSVRDSDNGIGPDLTFHVSVVSAESSISIKADTPAKPIPKDKTVTISAKYLQNNLPVNRNSALNDIPMELDIYKSDEMILSNIKMNYENGEYSYALTTLKEFGAGEYSAIVHAETNYFKKESEAAKFTLSNDKPSYTNKAESTIQHSFEINIPGSIESYKEQSWTVDLSEMYHDPNGDPMTWTIASNTADVKASIDGSSLTITTKKDTITDGNIIVSVKDSEDEIGPELTAHVSVVSVESSISIKVETPSQPILKGKPVTISAKYLQNDTAISRSSSLNTIPMELDIYKSDKMILSNIRMKYENGEYTYELTSLNEFGAGEYSAIVHAETNYFKKESEAAKFTLSNAKPVYSSNAESSIQHTFEINVPVNSESYKEQTWTVDLSELYDDPNGDKMTWTIASNTADVKALIADSLLTVTTKKDTVTDGNIIVSVKDSEGEVGPEVTFHVSVVSIENSISIKAVVPTEPIQKDKPVTISAKYLQDNTAVAWDSTLNNIPMELDVYKSDELILSNIGMTYENGEYSCVLSSLKEFGAGEYSAVVHAQSNYFKKESEPATFTLSNAKPSYSSNAESSIKHTFDINIPGNAESYKEQSWTLDLSEIFYDPNGDPMTWTITSNTAEVKPVIEGSLLTITTKEGITTAGQVLVSVTDIEGQAGPDLTIGVDVVSIEKVYETYSAVITPKDLLKNTDIDINVTVYDAAHKKVVYDTYMPQTITVTIQNGEQEQKVKLAKQENGIYTGTFHTDKKETKYSAFAEIKVGEMVIPSLPIEFTTKNRSPIVVKELSETVHGTLYPSLGKDIILDLNEYFSDPDDDPLTYSILGSNYSQYVNITISENQLTIHPISGKSISPVDCSFSILANDEEGLSTTSQDVVLTIWPLLLQVALALAAALVITAIVCVIRWKNAHFGDFAYDVSYGYKGLELPDGLSEPFPSGSHKSVSLNNYVPTLTRTVTSGVIPSDSIQKILIKPMSGNKVKVLVPESVGIHIYYGLVNEYDRNNQDYSGKQEITKAKTQKLGESITICQDTCRITFKLVKIEKC